MGRSINPRPGSIKSVQRGTTTGNVTVASTNMAKSLLIHNGAASASANAENASLIQTASNTLTYSKGSLSANPTVAWTLVEYY